MESTEESLGTELTEENLDIHFLDFDHEPQKWVAECSVKGKRIFLHSVANEGTWYVLDRPELKVSKTLHRILAHMTHVALEDCNYRAKYKKCTGKVAGTLH